MRRRGDRWSCLPRPPAFGTAIIMTFLFIIWPVPERNETVSMETAPPPPSPPAWWDYTTPVDRPPMWSPREPYCSGKIQPHFVLLHPPKSSGTTVSRNLYTYCTDHPKECTFCCNGHPTISPVSLMARERIPIPEAKDRCVHMLMTVRHPVEVVVSSFYESRVWLKSPNGVAPKCNHFECNNDLAFASMLRDNFTISEAIRFEPTTFYVRNKMAVFLTDFDFEGTDLHVLGTQALRETALRRLQREVHFMFIAEQLSEGIALFCAQFNLSLYFYENQWDWNPYKKVERSDPLWDEIAHQNSVDVEIYEEAVAMYNAQKARILRNMWPRVPQPFNCTRKKCTAAPPRCLSVCRRDRLWYIPADPGPDPGRTQLPATRQR